MNAATVFTWSSLQPALPEIYLTAAVCVVLMVGRVLRRTAPLARATRSRMAAAGRRCGRHRVLFAVSDTRVLLFGGQLRRRSAGGVPQALRLRVHRGGFAVFAANTSSAAA